METKERSTNYVPYATTLPSELVERLRQRALDEDVPAVVLIRRALRSLLGDEREERAA